MEHAPIGRPLFETLPVWTVVVFYLVAAVAVAVFAYGIWRRVAKYRKTTGGIRPHDVLARVRDVIGVMASHSRLRRNNTLVGLAHAAIFFGFAALFTGTVLITIDYDLLRPLSPALQFWKGDFYLVFSFVLDLLGLALMLGLVYMGYRRWVRRPSALDYRRPDRVQTEYDRSPYRQDDRLFFWWLLVLAATGFFTEAMRIQMHRPPFEIWSFVGWNLANLYSAVGLDAHAARVAYPFVWWGHGLIALGFIAYIPYAKSSHMLYGFVSLFLRDKDVARKLPAVAENATSVGYGAIIDFAWQELLQLDSCTKCGRCDNVCPAKAGGFPLSPRDVVLELRENANHSLGGLSLFQEVSDTACSTLGVKPDTLWSCTTCMACVDICPVGVEHVPMVIQMRRRLVEDGKMETNLQNTLEKLAVYGNSFGAAEDERGAWSTELEFEIKDARAAPVENLWFVGDFASFDPRIQKITRSAARVFQAAGLDFGIMFESEHSAGNDVRRVGEEGLYQFLVGHNVEMLAKIDYKRIITTDPHSYNTLKREYPTLKGKVMHHTELLAEMIETGQLKIKTPLKRKVTYHDPCHLSRYNQVIDAPRALLRALGLEVAEMERNGRNSFCCGAGGGRIWMTGRGKEKRPSEQRIEEALKLDGITNFVTACPKCNSMYADAVKGSNAEGVFAVTDIVELVEEALFGVSVEAAAV